MKDCKAINLKATKAPSQTNQPKKLQKNKNPNHKEEPNGSAKAMDNAIQLLWLHEAKSQIWTVFRAEWTVLADLIHCSKYCS